MNQFMMCSICSDANKFNSNLNNTKRIILYLKKINKNENIKKDNFYYKILNSFRVEKTHPHFMCGICMKVNTSELISLENELDNILTQLVLDDNLKDKDIYYVLNNLRGFYPMKCRTFERLTKSRK